MPAPRSTPHDRTVPRTDAHPESHTLTATVRRASPTSAVRFALVLAACACACADGAVVLDAGAPPLDGGITEAGVAEDAGLDDAGDADVVPDASPNPDRDGDGIADAEDPEPARVNVRLFDDSFDDASMGWLFSSVSMSIDPAAGLLEVDVLEPFVREGWIGPQTRWTDYFARTRIRVTRLGASGEPAAGRAGLIARVNQVSPDRYYLCAVDVARGAIVLTEHDGGGPAGTELAAAPLPVTLGAWVPLSIELRGQGLACRSGSAIAAATSGAWSGGSIGFRAFDATFAADALEVFDL